MSKQPQACEDFLDAVSQTLYGIGLQLENCLGTEADPAILRSRIDESIRGLHNVIQSIRERGELRAARPRQDWRQGQT